MAGTIGVGVVGLGRIGRIHAEIAKFRVDNARLVAVADSIEGLARGVGESLGVEWYTSYEKMLRNESVDAVIISTPTFLHREMILRAVEEGKHVLVEKPMTVTVGEALDVVSRVSKAGVKLQVGYMRRFDYAFKRAKEAIDSGSIGRVISYIAMVRDPGAPPGWAADPTKSGGIFLDMLSHDFDMARWLASSEVSEVYVAAGNYLFEEIREKGDLDVANIVFKFESGASGVIHAARKSTYGYDLRVEVYGSEGTVFVGSRIDPNYSLGTREGVTYQGASWFEKRFYDAYVAEQNHFIKCIVNDEKPLVNEVDGYRVVEVAEALWRSYRESRPVAVEYRV